MRLKKVFVECEHSDAYTSRGWLDHIIGKREELINGKYTFYVVPLAAYQIKPDKDRFGWSKRGNMTTTNKIDCNIQIVKSKAIQKIFITTEGKYTPPLVNGGGTFDMNHDGFYSTEIKGVFSSRKKALASDPLEIFEVLLHK